MLKVLQPMLQPQTQYQQKQQVQQAGSAWQLLLKHQRTSKCLAAPACQLALTYQQVPKRQAAPACQLVLKHQQAPLCQAAPNIWSYNVGKMFYIRYLRRLLAKKTIFVILDVFDKQLPLVDTNEDRWFTDVPTPLINREKWTPKKMDALLSRSGCFKFLLYLTIWVVRFFLECHMAKGKPNLFAAKSTL